MAQAASDDRPRPDTLVRFLQDVANRFGDRPALLVKAGFRYQQWSYAQLWEEAGQVATLLQQRGLKKGDRAVLWAPNCPQWVLAFFGCVRAGVLIVPLDLGSSQEFVEGVVAKTNPKLAFVSRATPEFRQSVGLPEIDLLALEGMYRELPPPEPVGLLPDDLVEVMFTSGTTGNPKGVMLTHGNLIANLESTSRFGYGKPSDRLVSLLPLSHMFEQTGGLLTPLRLGANVTYPTSRQPTMLFKTLRERKVTLLLLVPRGLDLFMKGIEHEVRLKGKYWLWRLMMKAARPAPYFLRRLIFRSVHKQMGGQLDMIFSGGAAVDPQLGDKWNLLGVKVIQGYGATEASPVISCHPAWKPRFDSAGLPLPGVEVRIAEDGEILVRGDNVTPGYWENQEQTEASFSDGWYKTGDLGLFDQDGFLHIKGRKKDMIVPANGQNVYPEDIESILNEHPDIGDAVVVGLPKDADIEVHAVFLMEEPERARDVVSWANKRLADHQRIRGFTVWHEEDFPRTHTFKVKKRDVIAVLTGNPTSVPSQAPARTKAPVPKARGVLQLAAEVSEVPPDQTTPEKTLEEDLHMDSLKRVELLSLIEQELGVYVDETVVTPAMTLAELEELVAKQEKAGGSALRVYRWPLSRWCSALRESVHFGIVYPLLTIGYRAQVTGQENLEGLKGPVLFAVNHNAIQWDSMLLRKILPRRWRRRITFAAAAEITFGRLWLAVLASVIANAFPISRDSAIRASLEHVGMLLDGGWSVAIFPEGDQRVGEEMLPFMDGIGLLGVESHTSVVPVRLVNTGPGGKGNKWLPWRDSVDLRFGKPLTFAPGTSYMEATGVIEDAVRAL